MEQISWLDVVERAQKKQIIMNKVSTREAMTVRQHVQYEELLLTANTYFIMCICAFPTVTSIKKTYSHIFNLNKTPEDKK